MSVPTANMRAVLERLAQEDAGLCDPTLMPPQHARALAELTNQRWNADLPEMAEARTMMCAGMPARWVAPENDTGTEAILHVHGGGWALCSPMTHEGASRRIADACGCPVLTVDYRLAPEHPYPAGLSDVLRSWRARDPGRRWSIAGDSAGANLALAAMLHLIDEGAEMPASALLFYGVYGADFDSESYVRNADGPGLTRAKMMRYWDWYAPESKRSGPTVAPLTASDAQLAALPALYLNAAELDPLLSDTEALVARLRGLGRDDAYDLFEGVVHGFMQMGSVLPEARDAFTRAGGAFRRMAAP
ncbi:alpha/beta hydrolase [Salipiger bermudensis]|uniref:alpha/beta hydrolase n=1 Tax=Salipiger bermudensis TaxID=344736 RepID=UPI001CD723B4|nr:alpha/beta hydrolase [Salipiger bermudensis]MCA0963879.1 alpha/beta hydrolase [Salipiger bermudensis]